MSVNADDPRVRTDSLLSLNPSELFDDESEYRHLCRLFEKQFGEGIFGPSKRTVTYSSKRSARRLQHLNPFGRTGYTVVYQNKSGYKITMDVQQFKVSELTLKVVDQCIVIEGKHKDRKDFHGFISRSFTRKFFLPKTMDPDTLSAKLSLDGLLSITALSKDLPAPRVRVLDICTTRKRALATGPTPISNRGNRRPAAKPAAKSLIRFQKPKFNVSFKIKKAGKPKPQESNPSNLQAGGDVKPPQAGGDVKPPQAGGDVKPPQASGDVKRQGRGNVKPHPPKHGGKAQ